MKKNQILLLFTLLIMMSWSFNNEVKAVTPHQKVENEDPAKADIEKLNQIIANKSNPAIWIFTGNSITQGAKHTHGLRSYPEIFGERIRWEMGRSRDFIINTAISGNTTMDILSDFERRIGRFNPTVVILMIGTNDAAVSKNISLDNFASNLSQLITKIRNIGAIPIFLSPNPITDKETDRSRLPAYVTKSKETAIDNHVLFVDNWTIWNTELQIKYDGKIFSQLLNDPIHPNGLGHKEIAYALFKALSIFDSNQPTCGGTYYEGEH